jgi:hypothetical protein
MKRALALVIPVLLLCAFPYRQSFAGASPRAGLANIESGIQGELKSHGDRVIGNEAIHWTTRLEGIDGCRASISVRTVTNYGEPTVRVEKSSFSLGAINPYNIDVQKNWVVLYCFNGEKCIFSTTNCATTRRDGVALDCTPASGRFSDSLKVNFDGDAASGTRLQQSFRRAVDLCRESQPVAF